MTLLKKLQALQNRSIRIICKPSSRENTENEEKQLDLIPLQFRRALHLVQLTWSTNNLVDKHTDLIRLKSSNVNFVGTRTRSQDLLQKQIDLFRPNKSLIEKSVSYTSRKAWNTLPTWAHQSPDKKTLASYLLADPTTFLNF